MNNPNNTGLVSSCQQTPSPNLDTLLRSLFIFLWRLLVWLVFQRWPVVLKKLCVSSLNKGRYECALR